MADLNIPPLAQLYLGIINDRQDHPFIRNHFFQVTWLALADGQPGNSDFFALEFRIRNHAALVCRTGPEAWAAGDWVKLAHPGADITCSPHSLTITYFRRANSFDSLDAALAHLSETTPKEPGAWQSIKNWLGRIGRRRNSGRS